MGQGRYVADINLDGQAACVFLRSVHAHADIAGIDTRAALASRGVLAIFTGLDARADGLGDIPCPIPVKDRRGQKLPRPGRPLLAGTRVRFVGEPIAMVVAETLTQARDALEQIDVDYRPLPAVATMEEALAAGAPQIWEGAPGNRALFWQLGDEAQANAAFERAFRIVAIDLVNNRLVPCPMEPRAVLGAFAPSSGRYTLYTSSQGAHQIKEVLAEHTLKVPADSIRVIVPDVGGGFGTKVFHYPEEALALWAARKLGRPVKWIGERSEAFMGDTHGRDQRNRAEGAFDAEGRLLALKVHTTANMGAYLNQFGPAIPTQMTGCMLSGVYAIPVIFAVCEGVYTNTVPVDAYRGAGRPEAAYLIERLMDAGARAFNLGVDEIRRRNFIRPDQMPYRSAAGPTYDTGEFARNMDDAMAAAGWDGFPARRRRAQSRGRLRGMGMATYIEICGFDEEEATIRFVDGGKLEILIGTQSTGQGHETAYAQIAAGRLGIAMDRIRVVQGDTDRIPFGKGTSGSRSLPVGGPAVEAACSAVIERGRIFAAHLLQTEPSEIVFADGRFGVAGSGRGIALMDLAAAAQDRDNLPAGEPTAGLGTSARYRLQASTFPNGCHICEVEIDPDTGAVEIVGYWVVDDFGTIINPLLLAGQIQGGVAQGIGQALLEETVYEAGSAQLRTGSFVDYALPRAADVPAITPRFNSVPCSTNPMGVKGAGEAGAIAACPAVINAILDALAPLGVAHIDMPATPEKIWRAIRAARPLSAQER
jgi:carbon-monoxide dehydrogenase large subunit